MPVAINRCNKRINGQKSLSLLPLGASLINFAPGLITDDDALLSKLDCGALSYAV